MTATRVQCDVIPGYPTPLSTEVAARIAGDAALQTQIAALGGGSSGGGGSGGGRTAMTKYLGQVATNCVVPTNANQFYTQFNSRSRQIMKDAVAQVQMAFPNWNVATSPIPGPTAGYGGIEHTNGQPVLLRAAIEYPVGTFRALLFNGQMTGTIVDGGTLLSDVCEIDIPFGAAFYVRTYWSCPAGGLVWANDKDGNQGEAFSYGVGGIPDLSRGGAIVDSVITNGTTVTGSNGYVYRPCAIVAPTTKRSIALFGDSRINNYQDFYTNDTSSSRGAYMRSLADNFAYISTACGGDRLAWFLANSTRRLALAAYCSHVICEYGINDVNQSGSAISTIAANLQAFYALVRGQGGKQPIFQATYEPYTTSTDSWASYAGQAPAGNESVRVGVNTAIRAGLGQTATIDTAAAFEDGLNSGRWKTGQIDGPLTPDGLHENYAGATWFKNTAHISPSLFTFY